MRRRTKAALTLAATVTTAAALAALAAGPASAKPYPPPSIHLLCTAANGDSLHGSVCALPPGQTTAPNNYSATIAVSKVGAAGATVILTIDPPLQISTTPLATGTVGVPYRHDLIAHGGAPPYSWFVVTSINELPPGLTLGSTPPDFNNVLTGTPTQAGTFSFPMQVQDSQDNWASGTVTVTIDP